jgi:Mce-associated membrane protein
MADEDDQQEESVTSKADALALIQKAEAEAAEAEALAAAARASARAAQLRREALAMAEAAEDYGDAAAAAADAEAAYEYDETAEDYGEDYEEAGGSEFADATDAEAQHPVTKRTGWRRWAPLLSATATVAAVILTIGFAAASTYMVLHHRDAIERQKREETFVAAAKQGIINMIALDFTKAKESIQAVIDNSTGQFKDEVQRQANDLVSKVEQSKTITEGTINGAAVESGKDNSAVVLVAATSRVTNSPPGKEEPPKVWRLRVTIADVGGQYKMSKVEYVQ